MKITCKMAKILMNGMVFLCPEITVVNSIIITSTSRRYNTSCKRSMYQNWSGYGRNYQLGTQCDATI